jgi:hypothetical protein
MVSGYLANKTSNNSREGLYTVYMLAWAVKTPKNMRISVPRITKTI